MKTINRDAELLRKQSMVLFLGGKSTGKTSLINYLLGIDDTSMQLTTGLCTRYNYVNCILIIHDIDDFSLIKENNSLVFVL